MYSIEESGLNRQMAFTQKYGYIWKPQVQCFSCGKLE